MRAIASGVLIGVLVGGAVLGSATHAQPVTDRELAKSFYKAAEQAVQEARYADAITDYTKAYELTQDPALFYKIGSANERAGNCDVALVYYGRYLREAKGSDAFVALTRERIRACGGDDRNLATAKGSAGTAPGTSTADGNPRPEVPPPAGSGSAVAATTEPAAPGSAVDPAKGLPARNRAAWLLVASSVAFATVGGVLAYSATSAEKDIDDLYIGLNDQSPTYDERVARTYKALIAEGERYETLSLISFGLAGASAIAAGVLFWRAPDKVHIAPTASANSAGVTIGGRF
ncbi:MAG: hypothetical protein SFX73_20155 [Kofleriaceae bacterium]|nr:hypothetical protein [Kofleriaceae bacterium]